MDARPAAIATTDTYVRGTDRQPVSIANPRRITWSSESKMATGSAAVLRIP
ncbi:MAG: hypothetical protein JWN22_258 [Nocardioides sp.]|jgi:hypothetical protein|nr:hypothetical protein [Nocardioides sp.]